MLVPALVATLLSAPPAGAMVSPAPAPAQAPVTGDPRPVGTDRIADIQVHGNTVTDTAQIVASAGVVVGSPFTESTLADVQSRLAHAHRFERIDVLKRFASIEDPSQIALVIIVDEGRVMLWGDDSDQPGLVTKRSGLDLMAQPILSYEDGYGAAYGAQLAWLAPVGRDSRLSMPMTWGGDRRAAAELEIPVSGAVTRLKTGASLSRRTHPFFDASIDRRRVWARAERDLGAPVRVGATAAFESVGLTGDRDRYAEVGVDATVDTRIDPFLPRHAVYVRAAWSRLRFDRAPNAHRSELDTRAYLGAPFHSVVVVRGLAHTSSVPLPLALKPMLGGVASLRGLRAGSEVGDTLVAASAEWRVPLNSPLSVGKVGVSAFLDVASVHDKGRRVYDQQFERGIGGGAWLSAAVFRVNIAVARGVNRGTRVHLTLSSSF